MDRREFVGTLAGGLLAAPFAAEAQPSGKVWRIGWLGDGTRAARESNTLEPLREGLRELGYVEGKNIFIDARWSDGNNERLAQDAADFVRLKMDVIVTHGSIGGRAAKKATATIPIVVAAASDFVAAGLVASLARPGGNLTGTNDQAAEVTVKQIEFLADVVPGLRRVAVLWNRSNSISTKLAETLQAAARQRSLAVTPLAITRPEDIEKAIETALRERVQGVIVAQESWTLNNRARIVQLGLAKNLPVVSASRLFPQAGALASYGTNLSALYKHAAVFVDKILKGAKPGDLPVEQPTTFELVINLKTAKALGLTIPPSLLGRADEVIQ